ncbi:MAG: hypothetical protein H7A47_16550 [Verrucomicrobiales bacterium]|nr:hypothetical protein [Verrucomicrobiales bacterium]
MKLTNINPQDTAPYHLINTALNVPSSQGPALRDRDCDFFLFSKKWTGSPSTGYPGTSDWKANGKDLDLATAMAVSGAAVSSHMGLASMPTLIALLTLLNVRLGFWIKKPSAAGLDNPLLLYLKLSVAGNESEIIKRHRINNPDFPHQTTLDQFFDQEQFEAYRQLGVHAAEGLFLPALTNNHTKPNTVPAWFVNLAKNLLEPENA